MLLAYSFLNKPGRYDLTTFYVCIHFNVWHRVDTGKCVLIDKDKLTRHRWKLKGSDLKLPS